MEKHDEIKNLSYGEDTLDNELLAATLADASSFDREIEKQIDRRIRRAAIKVVLVVLIIVALVFCGVSPALNLAQGELTSAAKASEGKGSLLLKVLDAYYETTHPYMEVADASIEAEGFGVYSIGMNLLDHREAVNIGVNNTTLKWNKGEISVENDAAGRTVNLIGVFDKGTSDDLGDVLAELETLPASSYISLSISLKDAVDVDTLLAEKTENLEPIWMQVYQPSCDFQGGISLVKSAAWDDDYRDDANGSEIKKMYLSNLQMLADNPKLWNGLDLYSGLTSYVDTDGLLEKNIEDLNSSEEFKTKNYCISGTRDEIIGYLNSHDVTYISVDKVKLSRYEK